MPPVHLGSTWMGERVQHRVVADAARPFTIIGNSPLCPLQDVVDPDAVDLTEDVLHDRLSPKPDAYPGGGAGGATPTLDENAGADGPPSPFPASLLLPDSPEG